MTQLNNYSTDKESLKELLIKNMPPMIRAGNEKETSNGFSLKTVIALDQCKFINYNSKDRISFMIFDFDTYNDKEAVETFKNIGMFYDFLIKIIGFEPTFITQTNKGFHFAYHLKNHIFIDQQKPLAYLNNIKKGIIEKVGCDPHGSTRNLGVWRNPLLHNYYYSGHINYELNDFKKFATFPNTPQKRFKRDIVVRQYKKELLVEGNRNDLIFYASMAWAKNRKNLSLNEICTYASLYNKKADIPLDKEEIAQISSSVYKYYKANKIHVNTRDINEGAMNFPKIFDLAPDQYKAEVKRRRRLSAERTNKILGKEKKKEIMLNAKKYYNEKRKNENLQKINKAIKLLEKESKNKTISAIARIAKLDRKTVRKYILV